MTRQGRVGRRTVDVDERIRRAGRELKMAGLALLGAFGAFTFSMEAAQLPAIAALLAVSLTGWYRILFRAPENELVESSADDLSKQYGWGSIVLAIPPLVFVGSTYLHAQLHFGLEEVVFMLLGFVTAFPPIGFAIRSFGVYRLAEARETGQLNVWKG